MGQKKGQTGNPNGRPVGSKNKTTNEIKILINQFISGNLDTLQREYDLLEPKEKLQFFKDLLKFLVPSKTEAEIKAEVIQPELTEEQITAQIAQLEKEIGVDLIKAENEMLKKKLAQYN